MADSVHYHQVSEVPGLVLGAARFVDFSFERHFHLDFHIGLVTDGVQRQRFNGKTVRVGAGCIALMPPGEIHDGVGEDGDAYTLKTFRVAPDLLASVAQEIGGAPREPSLAATLLEDPALAHRLLRLHDAMSANADVLAVQSEWLALADLLLAQSRAIVPETVQGALSPLQWQRVRDYCFAHLAEKITLDALADLCGLGRFAFLKQFKQTIGMTPHAWLVRLRLEHACSLLSRRPQAIASVAQAVGFYDQSHFNRAFRQAFGVAPSTYQA
ncbi:AraC family transcriptional regulator [Paraburkholderia tropica]|uniref:Transcriptional regulator, AraC family n=1 Tax=Paraburkholderia tropica TaxID=92647 RepID=A0AAQ1GJR9_9BURK|nr:AraC family transcriptional regulator [Paraburkholderia tropica]QNB13531.1 AraC family transcriptional regulator [Paraburkholderia tropica]RQN38371.1 AraC family transcriptional regulator [Paraburkholderia tropica]SEK06109.1 transcriptional regulator, AraC family [Paraburkholderia tropica]